MRLPDGAPPMPRETPFLAYWRRLNAALAELGAAPVMSDVAYRCYVRRAPIEDAAFECAVAALALTSVSAAAALALVEA